MSTRLSQVSITLVIVFAVVVLVLSGSSATAVNAASGCKKVEGKVNIQLVDDSDQCSSAYGCGMGTIKGDIKGTFEVATTSFVPSVDYATTGVVFTTADTVFTTSTGTLLSKDGFVLSTLSGEYAEVITIIGGTGSYEGATGTLTATGAATTTSARGIYSGLICLP